MFTEGTCKLLNLVVTDLVDEDLVLNHRKQAASALLFGMVALVTKPGQTFAPLIGTWLLCAYTGKDAPGESSWAGEDRPVSSVSSSCTSKASHLERMDKGVLPLFPVSHKLFFDTRLRHLPAQPLEQCGECSAEAGV